jgi:uncharacterized membrane protein
MGRQRPSWSLSLVVRRALACEEPAVSRPAQLEAPRPMQEPSSPPMPNTYLHPVNRKLLDEASRGERIADRVTGFLGSWRFIVIQSVVVLIWVAGNIFLLFNFDPYPFILLNLAFSTQAAYAAPLILLAGNRASIRDRMTLEHAAEEADYEEVQNEQLLRGNLEILEHVDRLEHQIIELEKRILDSLEQRPG